MNVNEIMIEEKLREFLSEDLGFGDITTDSVIDDGVLACGTILCKEEGVVAGLMEASKVFEIFGCTVKLLEKDGNEIRVGTPILRVTGTARAILKCERTALNILMRMSGVATVTRIALVNARKGNSKIKIACSRKTAPGFRYFDKKAVEIGGGDTHRLRLDDCVLIKSNHLKLVGSIKNTFLEAKKRVSFTKKIEIEAETFDQAIEAAEAGADIILLDNMEVKEIREILLKLGERDLRKKVLIEASGRIDLGNVLEYAKTGVDIISMGYLTHSAKALDMSLDIEPFKS
jgi:nicotinate-nucleotide pyrophosphorylase (carboxylating)